jgi:predicted DNA-binding protein
MQKENRVNSKRVNITIDKELNDRWNIVAKRHGLKKSQMIQELLEMIIPALEEKNARSMIKNALLQNAKGIEKIGRLL